MYVRCAAIAVTFSSLLFAQQKIDRDRFEILESGGHALIVRSMDGQYRSFSELPVSVRNELTQSSKLCKQVKSDAAKTAAAMVAFVVSNAGDDADSDIDDGVYSPATLRSAIQNANKLGGSHAIYFSPGITTIQPATQLPWVEVALVIDGTVSAGKIILTGSAAPVTNGLTLTKTSTVTNMIFKSWKNVGLALTANAVNSTIQRNEFTLNKIGLNTNASGAIIGSEIPEDGNIAHGNTQDGIDLVFANDNIVINNFSGTKEGLTASPNTYSGIYILGERNEVKDNVISGNNDSGLEIGEFSKNTLVEGNYIGVDKNGVGRLPNTYDGISTFADKDSIIENVISGNGYGITVLGQASLTYIGGNFIGSNITEDSLFGNRFGGLQILGEGVTIDNNLISCNTGSGIILTGLGGAVVKRNDIGIDQSGTLDWGNSGPGINILSDNNVIGGTADDDMNIISGNGGSGIEMYGGITFSFPGPSLPNYVRGNVIHNNYIGTNHTGSAKIPNSTGISMQGYIDSNFVRENLISGNQHHGVWMKQAGGGPTRNIFTNNFIGTTTSGKAPLSNDDRGIYIQYGSDNLFGGPNVDDWNLISGNNGPGIWIQGGSSNTFRNNVIGANDEGNVALPNNGDGVYISYSSNNNVIQHNLISGNHGAGVNIETESGQTPDGNVIIGNTIGMDNTQWKALPNSGDGVLINNARNTHIGGATLDSTNYISGNINYGVYIYGDTSRGNFVRGNFIGTNYLGAAAIPNSRGIVISNSNRNIVGGIEQFAGNLVSGNLGEGIYLFCADSNEVYSNFIGIDIDETKTISNGYSGIIIDSSNYNTIGTEVNQSGNTISGNKFAGIELINSSTGNKIYANYIGTDFTGTKQFPNEEDGIQIYDGANRTWVGKIGGGNTIRYNKYAGIIVADSNQNKISENSIFGNGQLGIDLYSGVWGVSPNDELDADAGGNDVQNYPTLFFADGPFPLRVAGKMESKPNETYTIEFFSSSVMDSTGYGEGKTFIAAETVGTDSTGFGYFNFTIPVSVSSGMFITATATDFDGNTSEFSKCVEMKASDVYADIDVSVKANLDTLHQGDTLAFLITLHNNGPDSAMQVILKDTLSKKLTHVADSTSKGISSFSNGILTVTIDTLAAGEKVHIVLVAIVDSVGAIVNRVFASAMQGDFNPENNVGIDTITVPIPLSAAHGKEIPDSYRLLQNYPNPFNPSTNIRFDIPVSGPVALKVYDMLGREVATLVNGMKEAGSYDVRFNASGFATGVYLYTLKAGSYSATKKLLLLK